MNGKNALLTVLMGALPVLAAGCGFPSGAHKSQPVVLAEAKGICPTTVVYSRRGPPVCRFSRNWNATTSVFKTPKREWGVAYAFNCGSHAAVFTFDERMPGMDHMGIGGPEVHARRGSGYTMISKARMLDLINGVPPDFTVNGHEMAIDVASPCTWHVEAILGSKVEVAAAVPAVPSQQAPWWR